ncbi:hypothetical protein FJZ17_00730 [Candidatus Pacearchaeota archaeon]|nr:hypothetical protein [Candidatus Pacearchaeota archaeon]
MIKQLSRLIYLGILTIITGCSQQNYPRATGELVDFGDFPSPRTSLFDNFDPLYRKQEFIPQPNGQGQICFIKQESSNTYFNVSLLPEEQ